MQGLVVKNTGSWYQVKTDDDRYVECKIKGNFRLKEIRTTNTRRTFRSNIPIFYRKVRIVQGKTGYN